ncbi:MAG: hypothetical protein ACRDZX_08875 [Acidimicrobiales bacterium]
MTQTEAPERAAEHRAPRFGDQVRRSRRLAAVPAALGGSGSWRGVAVLSALVTVFSWRALAWRPVFSGLNTWQAGITLAFTHHLQWGPQALFTFGPYGFVEDILPFARLTAALGLLYAIAVTWGLAALIVSALRPAWGLFPAAAAAWVAVVVAANRVEAPELGMGVALGLALAALRPLSGTGTVALHGLAPASGLHPSPAVLPASTAPAGAALGAAGGAVGPSGGVVGAAGEGVGAAGGARAQGGKHQRLVLLALLGALAGFSLLVEISVGLVCTGLLLLAAVGPGRGLARPPGRGGRAAVATVVPFVAAVLVPWAAAGQGLANLPSYFRGSLSVLLGYAPAMSASAGRQTEDWFALVDLAVLAGVYALALRHRPNLEKAVTWLAVAGWTWDALKEGFVRHDLHDLVFFSLVVIAIAIVSVARPAATFQAGAMVVAVVLACVAAGGAPRPMLSPIEDATALAQEVGDIALSSQWEGVQDTAQAEILATGDALSPGLVAKLRARTVATEPLEDAMSFAYPQLRWDPEPVLQAYTAYTGYLDRLDATFLGSVKAPALILYQPDPIGSRNTAWDPPATMQAMYCHYTRAARADGWLVLRRVPDRCGRPRLLARDTAHFDQWLSVPPAAAGSMVAATFSLGSPLPAELQGVALKPPAVRLEAVGSGRPAHQTTHIFRFVTGTAGDYHVLSAPPALGYPVSSTPMTVSRLKLTGGGWSAGQGEVTVTFYSEHLGYSVRPGQR